MTLLIDPCPPSDLSFDCPISKRTAYGLIWGGKYHHHQCVIKMIMLDTGYHYDKNSKQYLDSNGHVLSDSKVKHYFGHNDDKPFLHYDFKHRRSMSYDAFMKEIDNLLLLNSLHIAPRVYGYGINQTYRIHYGFIIMKRLDGSLKDIFLQRQLTSRETTLVDTLITQLHQKHQILHGDLKPSNIGVSLNSVHQIESVQFFDCQKVRKKLDMSTEEFNTRAEREKQNFNNHIIKNIHERPATGKPK